MHFKKVVLIKYVEKFYFYFKLLLKKISLVLASVAFN